MLNRIIIQEWLKSYQCTTFSYRHVHDYGTVAHVKYIGLKHTVGNVGYIFSTTILTFTSTKFNLTRTTNNTRYSLKYFKIALCIY